MRKVPDRDFPPVFFLDSYRKVSSSINFGCSLFASNWFLFYAESCFFVTLISLFMLFFFLLFSAAPHEYPFSFHQDRSHFILPA